MPKGGFRNCENRQILPLSQSTKAFPPHPCALVTQLPITHPLHSGFTLIGDRKQTIIQAHTSPGKIAKASYTVDCNVSLNEAAYSNCIQSMETTTLPDSPVLLTQLSATYLLLELSLGCLEMQALTASTLQFEQPQWLHLCLCLSETLAATFSANLLKYTMYKITDDN